MPGRVMGKPSRRRWQAVTVWLGMLVAAAAPAQSLELSRLDSDPVPVQVLAGDFDGRFVAVSDLSVRERSREPRWWRLTARHDYGAADQPQLVLRSPHLNRVEVWLPPTEGDETDVRTIHRDYLTQCDGALIYYGNATEAWVLAKLSDLRKDGGYGRETPLTTRAIYMTPPLNTAKERFRTREALVLKAGEMPEVATLAPFLAELGFERTA